ncbi:MAG: serine hydrolase [Candidatus Hermodarchaeota archaeon]
MNTKKLKKGNFLGLMIVGFLALSYLSPVIDISTKNNDRRTTAPDTQNMNFKSVEIPTQDSRIRNRGSTQFNNNFANLSGHAWKVREVLFSPNGLILASGSSDGSVRLWNVTNGEVLKLLQRHHYDVITLAFSPDGTILASGGWDKKINLWNVSSGALLQTWSVHPHVAMDLTFSPDGSTLAVGSGEWDGEWTAEQNNTLRLLDVTNGETVRNFTGHTNAVSSVAFSIDGLRLVSGSWDKTIKLWNVTTGAEIHSFSNHTEIISSIALSPDDLMLASGSFDKTIKLWNVSSGALLQNLTVPEEVWSVAFSGNEPILAAAVGQLDYWPAPNRYWEFFGPMQDGVIQLWNITSGTLVDTLVGHKHIIDSIAFSPDGTILASASWDWTIKLWGKYSPLDVESSTDEWPTSSPEEQGMDSNALNDVSEMQSTGLHSLLIIRHGKLVFEKYYGDDNHYYTRDSKHVLYSATKSFTSALIGIAIEKGFIESTDQRVLDFFPEYTFSNVDSRKESMTLEHLLTMTSGIDWFEGAAADDLDKMAFSLDSVQYVLDRPMVTEPGTYYRYNSGASHLLSAIIQQTTGNTTFEFALKYLFEPLGLEESDVVWMADSQGNAFGGIGLFVTPRNMAKFGQLYLNNGSWEGEQIIPAEWVTISTSDHIAGIPVLEGARPRYPVATGYGYQWWISFNSYSAQGHNGKMIYVHPAEDLVIVFTSRSSFLNLFFTITEILNAILPDSSNNSTSTSLPSTISTPGLGVLMVFTVFIIVYFVKKRKNHG